MSKQHDYGYGQVCTAGGVPIEGYLLSAPNQEHGILSRAGATDEDIEARFPIGMRLRVLPNHACATGAQFPVYEALTEDGTVQTWERFHGW